MNSDIGICSKILRCGIEYSIWSLIQRSGDADERDDGQVLPSVLNLRHVAAIHLGETREVLQRQVPARRPSPEGYNVYAQRNGSGSQLDDLAQWVNLPIRDGRRRGQV